MVAAGNSLRSVAEALDRAVETVVRDCLAVAAGEEVLVVCNPATEELGALMRIVAQGEGAEATMAADRRARLARGRAAGARWRRRCSPPTS